LGVVVFVAEKNEEREREREREKGRLLDHKLNITDGFTDEFKSIGNSVCKNDTSVYILIFFILSFPTVIPLVYTKKIFSSVFINGYYKGIFNRKNSP
jgi:hypothetical protein